MTAGSAPWDADARPTSTTALTSLVGVLTIAGTYGLGRVLTAFAMQAPAGDPVAFEPGGELGGAIAVGACLMAVAPRVIGTLPVRTTVLAILVFASVAAAMIEGSAFAPALSPVDRLPLALPLQLGVALATAAVAVIRWPARPASVAPSRRPSSRPVTGLLAAALIYVVAYFITGAIDYALVTAPYYEARVGGLTTPSLATVLSVALAEGLLLTSGTIPLARTLTGSRRVRALTCGLALWVLGGLVPLLQEASLPGVLRTASAVEILFQKVPLGIAVVWLFAIDPRAMPVEERPTDGERGRAP